MLAYFQMLLEALKSAEMSLWSATQSAFVGRWCLITPQGHFCGGSQGPACKGSRDRLPDCRGSRTPVCTVPPGERALVGSGGQARQVLPRLSCRIWPWGVCLWGESTVCGR